MMDVLTMLFASVLVGLFGFGVGDMMALRSGPLGLAGRVRGLMEQEELPAWVREGASCVFCWSYWGAALCAALLAVQLGGGALQLVLVWHVGFGLGCYLLKVTGH